MAKIYISSTYADLKMEREAAAKAVRRLQHRAIYMEDYVAEDRFPLDKCLQDVKSCDVYVGIFAWRYGFIPGGYDKSMTHLEYETAKKSGIPRLIFLLDEDVPWPPKSMDKGRDRQRIERLRREIMDERLVNKFHDAHELSALVTAAVSNLQLPGSDPATAFQGKSKPVPGVSQKCDRDRQVNDFMNFFLERVKKCPQRPHFYISHGNDGEGHDSLIERLLHTFLRDYAAKQWGENYSAILYLPGVSWPKQGPLSQREKDLKSNLIKRLEILHESAEFDADTLVRLPCFEKHPLVILTHTLHSSYWDKGTAPLLRWYLEDFWGGLTIEPAEEIPLFLVFFNVIYQPAWSLLGRKIPIASAKKRIKEQLRPLSRAAAEKCPCLLLEELSSIEPGEVADWLSEYNIIQPEWKRKEFIDSVFREGDRPVATLCWRNLEKKLLTYLGIIEGCQYYNHYNRFQKEES